VAPSAPVIGRIRAVGLAVAITAVVVQTVSHLANYAFLHTSALDANGEYVPFAWASTVATFGAAFAAALAAVVGSRYTLRLGALALVLAFLSLDDMILIHERIGPRAVRMIGAPESLGASASAAVYLPLLALCVLLVVLVGRNAAPAIRNLVWAGLGLLAAAMVVDVESSLAVGEAGLSFATITALEEAFELGGWIVLATALTAVAVEELRLTLVAPAESPDVARPLPDLGEAQPVPRAAERRAAGAGSRGR
jgi:hypothetical protein